MAAPARPGRRPTISSGKRDAAGQVRPGIEVLRGNPHLVAAVADSLDFEHKYRSLVISWAPDDRPTDAQIGAVLDEFEKTAWGGTGAGPLRLDRGPPPRARRRGSMCTSLTARCDLETGRSLNIAPPGWQKTFDALRDAFNHQHGWSRPDDPARARGATSRAIAPTSRPRSCAPASSTKPARVS